MVRVLVRMDTLGKDENFHPSRDDNRILDRIEVGGEGGDVGCLLTSGTSVVRSTDGNGAQGDLF